MTDTSSTASSTIGSSESFAPSLIEGVTLTNEPIDPGTEVVKEETKEAEAADETPNEETNVVEEQDKVDKEDEKE